MSWFIENNEISVISDGHKNASINSYDFSQISENIFKKRGRRRRAVNVQLIWKRALRRQ